MFHQPFLHRFAALQTLIAAALLAGCAYAPPNTAGEASFALPHATDGRLAAFNARVTRELTPSSSAYWLLDRNDLALSTRLALIDRAVSTLDVQYFIWQDDATSRLLLRRLIYAAERGVRVRVLLDDLTLSPRWDSELAALDRHRRIEIRVFNPWYQRTRAGRLIEFAFRMDALNHRMHGKSVIADNLLAIVGGRNLGNRYFGLDESFVQNDLDMLVAGPLVRDISAHFDLFWNSSESYPLAQVVPRHSKDLLLTEAVARVERAYEDFRAKLVGFPLQPARWNGLFDSFAEDFAQGPGALYYDLPRIDERAPTQLYDHFKEFIGRAREELLISSPYFIPGQQLLEQLEGLVARGVRVVVVTNSLASNNHVVAHTGYEKWRRDILEAGVELYEARLDADTVSYYSTPPVVGERVGLHTKAVVVDGRWSFVGSPNVDPRSMILNTELAVVVDDEELAEQVRALILRDSQPANAWRVRLTEDDGVHWSTGDGTVEMQPARGFGQRIVEFFIDLLPLEKQG